MATRKKSDAGESLDATETLKDAPVAPPAPPSASEAADAVKALQRAIAEAIERAAGRLPPELRGNAFVVEAVLNQELDKVNFGGWRAQIVAECIALFQTGKSEVRHDPTELA